MVTDFSKIGYNPITLYNGGKWSGEAWDKLSADVASANAAGRRAFLAGSPWFPPEASGGLWAYGDYTNGCTSTWFGFMLRILIGDDHPPSPFMPAMPDQNTPFARLAEFTCPRGGQIVIEAPGAMWRSPAGYYCGLPGDQAVKHGKLKRSQAPDARDGVQVDGSFVYTNDGTGTVDEVTVFLLEILPEDPKTGRPAGALGGLPPSMFTDAAMKDPKIRPDNETKLFCRPGKVPHLDPSFSFELGLRMGQTFGTTVVYECPLNELKFFYYWSAQVNGVPDGHRFVEEVMKPFVRGVTYATQGKAEWFVGEAAGPEDLVFVTLALAEMKVKILGGTGHIYSWDDGVAHKVTDDDWMGGAVRFLIKFLGLTDFLFLITETDRFDELMALCRSDPRASYVTHILGAGGQDGVAKAVR